MVDRTKKETLGAYGNTTVGEDHFRISAQGNYAVHLISVVSQSGTKVNSS